MSLSFYSGMTMTGRSENAVQGQDGVPQIDEGVSVRGVRGPVGYGYKNYKSWLTSCGS